jgi:catechol-2,3-dioxygenase
MVAFYASVLGLLVTDAGEHTGRQLTFLSRRPDEHHQLVLVSGRNALRGAVRLLSQLSFRVAGLDAVRRIRVEALANGATAMEARNHGNSWSIYFEDPEGNRIEVYAPTPWSVRQPWREPLDLDRSNAEIEALTLASIQRTAGWEPVESWQSAFAARLEREGRADD